MTQHLPNQGVLEDQYDVIVVGSGAAGLSTAVRAAHQDLSVLVLEKTEVFGGTSAWSGGWLWIPRNPLAQRAGIQEPFDAPLAYVNSEMGDRCPDDRVLSFLEKGPEMVSFFEQETALRFIDGNGIPDFHTSNGHALGGRSVAAAPFDGRTLGDWKHVLRKPLSVISLWGMGIASGQDLKHFFNATRSIRSALYVAKRIGRHALDLLRYGRSTQLVNGNALVAALLKSAVDRGVYLQNHAKVSALHQQDGGVTGVDVTIHGQPKKIRARLGVVMAAGGFPHDPKRQNKLFPQRVGTQHFSAAPKSNTGDGLNMAELIGAKIRDDLDNPGAWSPVSLVPSKQGNIHFPHLIERAKPGIIAVLPNGKRFTSEADSYHDFMKALYAATPVGEEPHCWLIADHKAQRRWGLGWSRPFPFPTAIYERKGYLHRGTTVEDLARKICVPEAALAQTIKRFNRDAQLGHDQEFARGESPYNAIQGDPDNQPNSSLAPLEQAPFYAVRIVAGSLGTFAGIATNAQGQALSINGDPISGLFAVGNDMSSLFEGNYPSGGITLGPAMTFGYIIADVLKQQSVQPTADLSSSEEENHAVL